MRAVVFDGDPSEVAEALRALGISPSITSVQPEAPPMFPAKLEEGGGNAGEDEEEGGCRPVDSVGFATKVLTRRGRAPNQNNLLVEVYNAGETGILGSELLKKLRLTQSQFRGVMGAWGRRVAHTPGYDGESSFFAWEWDYDAGSYRYRLPLAVREAVQRELIDRQ